METTRTVTSRAESIYESAAAAETTAGQSHQQQTSALVYLASATNISLTRMNVLLRAFVLFLMGAFCAFILNILQMEYKVNLFPNNIFSFFQLNWWVLPLCGLAAIYIGFCYPFFDHKLGQCHYNDRDWSLIIRSSALFIGLNHLCAKIQFESSYQLFAILIVFCLLFWYWFDKTTFGLFFNMFNSFSVIIAVYVMRHFGMLNFSDIQFNYIQICLLCLIFSGGVTFGNIGRLLDFYDNHHEDLKTL